MLLLPLVFCAPAQVTRTAPSCFPVGPIRRRQLCLLTPTGNLLWVGPCVNACLCTCEQASFGLPLRDAEAFKANPEAWLKTAMGEANSSSRKQQLQGVRRVCLLRAS